MDLKLVDYRLPKRIIPKIKQARQTKDSTQKRGHVIFLPDTVLTVKDALKSSLKYYFINCPMQKFCCRWNSKHFFSHI